MTADVKVEKICEQETMRSGKKKQDVLIADGSGTAKGTLWEEHIRKLAENSSYKLQNFVVRE